MEVILHYPNNSKVLARKIAVLHAAAAEQYMNDSEIEHNIAVKPSDSEKNAKTSQKRDLFPL